MREEGTLEVEADGSLEDPVEARALADCRPVGLCTHRQTRNHGPIGCLVALLALISPRLALFCVWLFSDLLSRAFDSWLLPLLGFFLLPWTTLAYAVMWSTSTNEVYGFEWFIVVLAFLVDLSSYGSGARYRGRD